MERARRRLGTWMVLLVLVLGLAAVPSAEARRQAATAGDIALYRSDAFGHAFFYDRALWSLVAEEASDDLEAAVFSDGDVIARVYAFRLPAESVRGCLDAYIDDVLPSDDGIVDVSPLTSPYPDQPAVLTDGATYATADVVLTLTPDDPRGKAVARVECRELIPGASMLITSIEIPGDAWNAGRSFAETMDVPSGVGASPVPWLVWHQPGLESLAESGLGTGWFRPIVDADGDLLGVIGRGNPPCPEPPAVYELARAAADGPGLILDPGAFVAVQQGWVSDGSLAGDRIDPVAIEWLYPAPASDGTVVLGPGDLALARIALPEAGFDMYYLPDGGPRVDLGGAIGGCGGGGGAAPVRIDME